ncbi:MAG: hypothetical protein AB7G37_19695 [Solirubrobacteraceae bacterium]
MAAKKRRKKTRSQRQADARRRQPSAAPVTVEAPAAKSAAAADRPSGTKPAGKRRGKDDAKRPRSRRAPVPPKGPVTHKASLSEAPPPIWHPFPLTEILILVGMVVAIVGLFTQSISALIGGLLVLGASSTELAVREHFAGYRSHSAMIAGLGAMIVGTLLALLLGVLDVGIPVWTVLIAAAAVFALLFNWLRNVFVRRTGLTFRV